MARSSAPGTCCGSLCFWVSPRGARQGQGLPDLSPLGTMSVQFISAPALSSQLSTWFVVETPQVFVRESLGEDKPVVEGKPASFAKVVMAELANLKLKNKPWPGGMHSTQHMFGCEIQEDGSSNGFWQIAYHLTLDLETLTWVSANPMALQTKCWTEMEHCYAKYDKAFPDPPRMQMTKHPTQDRGTLRRCWALSFYPWDISLNWWLNEELALETENVEMRSSGDGIYQTWAAVWVPEWEGALYTCHVQHSSLNHTLTVAWESPCSPGLIAIATFTSLATALVVIAIFTKRCLQARNKDL